jgi:predicted nucleic acid-binding Zn ribbon protein
MKPSAPRAVREILPNAIPQLADRLVELDIRRRWGSVVGAEVARRAAPRALSGDCLHVVVDNSPWLQELTLRAPDIVAALARCFGAGTVRSLAVTLGSLPSEPAPAAAGEAQRPRGRRPVNDEDRRAVDDLVRPISDRAFAGSLRRLLLKARCDS